MQHIDHSVMHPNGSIVHQQWAQEKTLHVATMYSNPYRWKTRQALFNDFIRHMRSLPNVKLYVGELAYGERPFEVTSALCPTDFQFRTREILWHKENVLNLVIQRFDPDWLYGAYIDGDMHFNRNDLALETIHQLQIHEWVQMFGTLVDLDHEHNPLRAFKSFARVYTDAGSDGVAGYRPTGAVTVSHDMYGGMCHEDSVEGRRVKRGIGTTGGAWGFRRKAFDNTGGLLDTCILGSGDWHMAYGLIGEHVSHPEDDCGKIYTDSIRNWQNRALDLCRKDVGYVPATVTHFWHSSRFRRGYGTRWQIIRDNNYNPTTDIFRDSNGVYQLNPRLTKFRDEIRRYFRSRVEDDLALMEGDTPLV